MTEPYPDQLKVTQEAEATQLQVDEEAVGSAVFLTGMRDLQPLGATEVEKRVLEWWESGPEHDCHTLTGWLASLPESFMTVAFQNSTRGIAAGIAAIRTAFDRYRRNELTFSAAMAHLGLQFGIERCTDRSWFDSVGGLAALMRWHPAYERACSYVRGSLLTGDPEIDQLRSSLLELMSQPHRFLDSSEREAFDRTFEEFRPRYVERYARAHEETVGNGSGSAGEQPGVDRQALQNLELLSRLVRADRNSLARVRVLLAWRAAQRCRLRVRTILEDHPRCHCSFIPGAALSVQASAAQLNRTIHGGIELQRGALRQQSKAIIAGLESESTDESDARQVAALLSQGSMVQLRPGTIEVLNSVLRRLPANHR